MVLHATKVHNKIISRVPNALFNRDSVHLNIFGMEGIPQDHLMARLAKIKSKDVPRKLYNLEGLNAEDFAFNDQPDISQAVPVRTKLSKKDEKSLNLNMNLNLEPSLLLPYPYIPPIWPIYKEFPLEEAHVTEPIYREFPLEEAHVTEPTIRIEEEAKAALPIIPQTVMVYTGSESMVSLHNPGRNESTTLSKGY
jgi:hypothetical protein